MGVAIAKGKVFEQVSPSVGGDSPATSGDVEMSGESPAVLMEVESTKPAPSSTHVPIDRSWLPLCNDEGEFFSSMHHFTSFEKWAEDRGIIFSNLISRVRRFRR